MAWRGGGFEEREMRCHLCEGSGGVDEEAASYDPEYSSKTARSAGSFLFLLYALG